jgi:hypothetical protein
MHDVTTQVPADVRLEEVACPMGCSAGDEFILSATAQQPVERPAPFRVELVPVQLPTHLCHYTPETLAKVLRAGGWRMQRCLPQRVLIDWPLSSAVALTARRAISAKPALAFLSSPFGLALNMILYPLALVSAAFGQTARMTVWATREDLP